jgi:undecaprenyl diphosphate synthase
VASAGQNGNSNKENSIAAERPAVRSGASANVPSHVAIIMDGNGRWAKQRLFPRIEGHRAGAKAVRMVVEESRRLGIRYLTLFSFSTENWLRPKEEVSALMRLFCQYVESERDLLLKHSIRLRAIGDRSRLPSDVRESLERVEAETRGGSEMQLILALSYGGRDEIAAAARALAERVKRGEIQPEDITPELVSSCMYAPDVPDPDLLIRTSDEFRISNFLLWQLAYSEIVVTKCFWPAFSKEEFARCLEEYSGRKRRFGLTDEQIENRTE